ncbi:hypothetical protein AK812_SmicGene9039 [Symbiodinium microadriaticum]|uniref:Uncharacterized protein n=1 Tax=Symbiodinium microadriaticum TaxID=2951 RepID=A0A1Q9EJD7_SYMMI|nr:hypothetical protein AK812_SmicGene9039 [Symbiodinium microadriaticum]
MAGASAASSQDELSGATARAPSEHTPRTLASARRRDEITAIMRSWSQEVVAEAEFRSFAAGLQATPSPLASPHRVALLRIPGPGWSKHPWLPSSPVLSQQHMEEVESDSVWESSSSVPERPLASVRASDQPVASLQVHLPGTVVPSVDAHLSAVHGHDILEERLAEILRVPAAAVKLINSCMHPK